MKENELQEIERQTREKEESEKHSKAIQEWVTSSIFSTLETQIGRSAKTGARCIGGTITAFAELFDEICDANSHLRTSRIV
jgi:hypothetical protein